MHVAVLNAISMFVAAPMPPQGFRVTGQRNDSKNTPLTKFQWDRPRDAAQFRRPHHYELLVSMGRLLMWHGVSSPLQVAIPPYIVSNVTLIAVNCFGTSSSFISIRAGKKPWLPEYVI